MFNKLTEEYQCSEVDMQRIDEIINELKTIMQVTDISQTSIVNALDGKCSRNTILSFMKGDSDCKLSTFLLILDVCRTTLRLETEKSKQAILSGDISEYRKEAEQLRAALEKSNEDLEHYKERYGELINKNTTLTNSIDKQQKQIEKYMERMENAENALYRANEDMRRKDSKIVDLLTQLGKW